MNVTLQVKGREMTFSEEELTAIVEKHFDTEATKQGNEVQPPTEGEWFEVNIQTINKELFKDERADRDQEETRQRILEAFEEVKKDPEKYGYFRTMMPKKDGTSKTVIQLEEYAIRFGDNMADWVEQAMEWAQRIANGESWEEVCNKLDTANWYRLVKWKCGYRMVGGSCNEYDNYPASSVRYSDFACDVYIPDTVPLVVSRKLHY